MATWSLSQLDARDRALFDRLFLTAGRRTTRLAWQTVTHAGGFWCSVAAASVPWFTHGAVHDASRTAMLTLAVSHVVVQVLKRSCVRPRPAPSGGCALIAVPDRFSFPSGHACASMAVALAYALAFPVLAAPLVTLAAVVGFSRVRLGVHYPGDVLIGQLIAVLTAVGVAVL